MENFGNVVTGEEDKNENNLSLNDMAKGAIDPLKSRKLEKYPTLDKKFYGIIEDVDNASQLISMGNTYKKGDIETSIAVLHGDKPGLVLRRKNLKTKKTMSYTLYLDEDGYGLKTIIHSESLSPDLKTLDLYGSRKEELANLSEVEVRKILWKFESRVNELKKDSFIKQKKLDSEKKKQRETKLEEFDRLAIQENDAADEFLDDAINNIV